MRVRNYYVFIVVHRQYAKLGKTAERAADVFVFYIKGLCDIRQFEAAVQFYIAGLFPLAAKVGKFVKDRRLPAFLANQSLARKPRKRLIPVTRLKAKFLLNLFDC